MFIHFYRAIGKESNWLLWNMDKGSLATFKRERGNQNDEKQSFGSMCTC